jgi:dTDP-glucose pyrophosphorylase
MREGATLVWRNNLVSPQLSVLKVIALIDSSEIKIAIVADETGKLLGTVTDGDVRRGILRGISFESPIAEVMNRNPISLASGTDREIMAILRNRSIRYVPVVDSENRITGLQQLDDLYPNQEKGNVVILMAGGLGKRLKPLTDHCPKPMLQVGGRPILETILLNFRASGFRRFLIAVNYKAEMIEDFFGDGSRWDVDIQFLRETQPLGTAGALSLIPEKPTLPMVVMNGDLLTKVDLSQLLDFHCLCNSQATMCVREHAYQVPYGVVNLENHRITGISEKPIVRYFVNAGIYVLDPSVLSFIQPDGYLDMPALFQKLISASGTTAAFPLHEDWLDIGQAEDFHRAVSEFKG